MSSRKIACRGASSPGSGAARRTGLKETPQQRHASPHRGQVVAGVQRRLDECVNATLWPPVFNSPWSNHALASRSSAITLPD